MPCNYYSVNKDDKTRFAPNNLLVRCTSELFSFVQLRLHVLNTWSEVVWIFNLFIPNGSGLNDYITVQDNGDNTFRSTYWVDEQTQTQTFIKIKIKYQSDSSFHIIWTFETSAPRSNYRSQWIRAVKPKQSELRLQKGRNWSELLLITFAWERAWATLKMSPWVCDSGIRRFVMAIDWVWKDSTKQFLLSLTCLLFHSQSDYEFPPQKIKPSVILIKNGVNK